MKRLSALFLALLWAALAAQVGAQDVGHICCKDGVHNVFLVPEDYQASVLKALGIVFWVDPENSTHGKAVALTDMLGEDGQVSKGRKWCDNLNHIDGVVQCKYGLYPYDFAGRKNTEAISKQLEGD